MIECRAPQNPQEFEQYYQLRWQILRAPWQQARGSEQDELESQSIHRLILNDKKQVIAIGRLHFTGNNTAQIRYMAVAESCHGQGFGQAIIKALEQVASQLGVTTINLNAREQALGFYQRLGYHGDKISHLLFDEIKHIAMQKQLIQSPQVLSTEVINLVETWHKTIPLSKAMGVNITSYNQTTLVATCDLLFNKNLHNTMFAGSIYTLATLTGWGWVALKLEEKSLTGDIVLAEAQVKYISPIEGIAFALTDDGNSEPDFSRLSEQRNEKISLTVNVFSGETVAARFIASYVVKPKKENKEC